MLFGLRCHYCGSRSQHRKGTPEFACTQCDAVNFFDSQGNVLDTPQELAAAPPTPQQTTLLGFAKSSAQQTQQQQPTFCNKCLNNQRMYTDSLSNYLPDEAHPQYQEYVQMLPAYKADLEKRYPTICKKCAPKAQQKMHDADYYGMSQQAAHAMQKTRSRRGRSAVGGRDDWSKWGMRWFLALAGLFLYGSLLTQMAWHIYGMITAVSTPSFIDDVETDFMFDAPLKACVNPQQLMRFDVASSCSSMVGRYISKALLASVLLLWYNHGLKFWYHHTYRVEYIHGQTQYFNIQFLLLLGRFAVWNLLSNPKLSGKFTPHQLLGIHLFSIAFMPLAQLLSERQITVEKWRIKGHIMPTPDEQDIFSLNAGPAEEPHIAQASSKPPLRLFPKDDRPFQISNLAPKPQQRGYSRLDLPSMPPPSPPDSMSDDGDAMDIDYASPHQPRQPLRSLYNHGATQPMGWGPMRNELFGIQDHARAEDDRRRAEMEEKAKRVYQPPVNPSPFHGRMPQAPMSVERRLRNPPRIVEPIKPQPLSERQDFMQQMREGIENGKRFQPAARAQSTNLFGQPRGLANEDEEDEDDSPAKTRTKGEMDLRRSEWHLPGDNRITGLEDLMGGSSFNIEDSPVLPPGSNDRRPWSIWTIIMWVVGVVLALAGAALSNPRIRRPVSLWLVAKMEEFGLGADVTWVQRRGEQDVKDEF